MTSVPDTPSASKPSTSLSLTEMVYLNGNFMPLEEAHVPVLDRGFIFGDGVYEVIPVYGGKAFRLMHHLQRLQNSLDAIRLSNPFSPGDWRKLIMQLIEKNRGGDLSVYFQLTRGVAPRDHGFPDNAIKPTVFMMATPLKPMPEKIRQAGIKAITLEDNRWHKCHIKAIALLPNILLRQQALEQGSQEAILLRNNKATEGSTSNLFIVKQGCLVTPPKGPLLLPGITRDLVVEIAHKESFCIKEQSVTEAELLDADEIWLTSSTREILPVCFLNDKKVGKGIPGLYWKQMFTLYQDHKQALRDEAEIKVPR
jgi:D-alanine transaminase